jgi:hypothetical protein
LSTSGGRGRLRRVGENELAHLREDAVGADHEVVAAGAAVGQLDLDPVVGVGQALDTVAEGDLRARAPDGVGEDLMQPRTGDAVESGELGADHARERVVGELRAVGEEEAIAVHGKAGRECVLEQPELMQRPHRVARLDDPDAVDVPLGVLLDDLDLDAAGRERNRAGEPADTAADDQDLGSCRWHCSLLTLVHRCRAAPLACAYV